MIVITIARKPFTGTVTANVTEWHTGCLNIDSSKIGTDATGRWPTNVLMNHRSGCSCKGTKRVTGGSNCNFENVDEGRDLGVVNMKGYFRKKDVVCGHADKDGSEIVDAWICVLGCPVLSLQEQTGTLDPNKVSVSRFFRQIRADNE